MRAAGSRMHIPLYVAFFMAGSWRGALGVRSQVQKQVAESISKIE